MIIQKHITSIINKYFYITFHFHVILYICFSQSVHIVVNTFCIILYNLFSVFLSFVYSSRSRFKVYISSDTISYKIIIRYTYIMVYKKVYMNAYIYNKNILYTYSYSYILIVCAWLCVYLFNYLYLFIQFWHKVSYHHLIFNIYIIWKLISTNILSII